MARMWSPVRLPYRKPPRWSAGNHSDYVGAALPYGVISTRHARGVLAGSEDFDVHGLIDLAKELYRGMELQMASSTIVQQDSNTTQATDRTKRDALSFGAKQIAIMTEVGLIAGSLHCLR